MSLIVLYSDIMRRSERFHALTESLRRAGSRGRTAQQLADEFRVTVRTIKRDLAALEASGLPLWSRTGPGGGYGLAEIRTLPPVNLSVEQALALIAAVAASPQAPYSDSGGAAIRKILDVVDPATRRRASELSARVWIDPEPQAPRAVLTALEHALSDQLTVRITYTDAAGAQTRREVEPMIFAQTRGRWYLIAWCRLRDAVRWFDPTRIERASVTRRPCAGHAVAEIGTPPPGAMPLGRVRPE